MELVYFLGVLATTIGVSALTGLGMLLVLRPRWLLQPRLDNLLAWVLLGLGWWVLRGDARNRASESVLALAIYQLLTTRSQLVRTGTALARPDKVAGWPSENGRYRDRNR